MTKNPSKEDMRLILFALALLTQLSANGQFNLYGDLEPGPYAVGFKQSQFANSDGNESKIITINLWYPASNSSDEHLIFRDYLNYKGKLGNKALAEDLSAMIAGVVGAFATDTIDMILEAKMLASKNPSMAAGGFPLVLWSSRYGTVEYQFIISEYLASKGYIVAFAEDVPNSPYPWQLQADEKENTLRNHISDLQATINHLQSTTNQINEGLAIISWSYAGESAVIAQIENDAVDAVIGLSSIGFTGGLYLGSSFPEIATPEKLTVPYLFLFEKISPSGNLRSAPQIFNMMHPNSRYILFNDLAHGSFNALEGMLPGIMGTNKVQSWSLGGENAKVGYEAISKIVVAYLEAALQQNPQTSFDKDLEQIQELLPADFLKIYRPSGEN